jgi:hypothetical protein
VAGLFAEIVLDTAPMNRAVVDEVEVSVVIVAVAVSTKGETVGETEVADEDTDLTFEVLTELVEVVVASGCPKYVDSDCEISNELKSLKVANGANGFILDKGASMTEVTTVLDPVNVVDMFIGVGDGGRAVCDDFSNAPDVATPDVTKLDVTRLETSSDSVRINK